MSRENIIDYLLEQLKMHGLSFVLLAMAIWYFYNVNNELRKKIEISNQRIIELYQIRQKEANEVINKNTTALNRLTMKIDEMIKK